MTAGQTVKWLGWAFLLLGVLGFVPGVTSDQGLLLGLFEVDAVHNVVHLVSGVAALVFAAQGAKAARNFGIVFGLVYGLVAVLGFVMPDAAVLGLFHVNMADNILHAAFALAFLSIGFGMKR